jgi:hypothetical protein
MTSSRPSIALLRRLLRRSDGGLPARVWRPALQPVEIGVTRFVLRQEYLLGMRRKVVEFRAAFPFLINWSAFFLRAVANWNSLRMHKLSH